MYGGGRELCLQDQQDGERLSNDNDHISNVLHSQQKCCLGSNVGDKSCTVCLECRIVSSPPPATLTTTNNNNNNKNLICIEQGLERSEAFMDRNGS